MKIILTNHTILNGKVEKPGEEITVDKKIGSYLVEKERAVEVKAKSRSKADKEDAKKDALNELDPANNQTADDNTNDADKSDE